MKTNLITEHLSKLGLLASGSAEQIAMAKNEFWAKRRRALQTSKRKKQKSIQVFFSVQEHAILYRQARKEKLSMTKFMKETVMHTVYHTEEIYSTNLLELRTRCFRVMQKLEVAQTDGNNHLHLLLTELQSSIVKIVTYKNEP